MSHSSLVGSIFERKAVSAPTAPTPPSASTSNGFPRVQHRSQSAFAKSREQIKQRPREIPTLQTASLPDRPRGDNDPSESWRVQAQEENLRRVAAMSEEEREEERAEILQRFGPNVMEVLRKAREAREAKDRPVDTIQASTEPSSSSSPVQPPMRNGSFTSLLRPTSPRPTSASSTRPPSRSERKIRFADITPDDIHVYESAPPSPRRKALALPAPSDSDGPTVSIGKWKPAVRPANLPLASLQQNDVKNVGDLEEGTPEDIRRRFFPTAPADEPSLEWMQTPMEEEPDEASPTIRFDLTGTPIPAKLSASLPTYLGLHHHAEGAHAGYTIEDIFLLSRSTVPAQRATMLGVLAKIAHKLARTSIDAKKGLPELAGQELQLRKRMLAAGVEAMSERASVGARAVELLWECSAQWDEQMMSIQGVELKDIDPGNALSTLSLDFVLPQISSAFTTADLPRESLAQLLAILHRLAIHSNSNAAAIVTSKGLIAGIFQRFLLTPIPSTDNLLPEPRALDLIRVLAESSRDNATALLDPTDSLLRYITTLPPDSSFPVALATQLLAGTLDLYRTLASYGLYANIATTAQEYFAKVSAYVRSPGCESASLRATWLRTLSVWTICARDPHRTSPSHDILWSQVVGWGWVNDVLDMRNRLGDGDDAAWAELWAAAAAFLEGARVNGERAGEDERATVVAAVKDGFTAGTEKRIVEAALLSAQKAMTNLTSSVKQAILPGDVPALRRLAQSAQVLASAIRLFLACTDATSQFPAFLLPFADLSSTCAAITLHPMWSSLSTPESVPYGHVLCRPISSLLACYLQLSRMTPGTAQDLWMAQAFAILCRLFPGDDEFARRTVNDITAAITRDFLATRNWSVPDTFWERGGMDVITPFLTHTLLPGQEHRVSPLWPTPQSLSTAATQRLPPLSTLTPTDRRTQPFPLTKDWVFCPLDHLLRSGDSNAFKNLPDDWDASETELVRAALLLARVSQDVLRVHGLGGFVMSREETVFGCMKVFMLEHGQQADATQPGPDTSEEVFRDSAVEALMSALLAPFAASASTKSLRTPPPSLHESDLEHSLDGVARRFLGAGTPFYQWYTDFAALYDAISFAHLLFARLLLPPLAMRYPGDFRRCLWGDQGHVLRTVRVQPADALTGCVAEFLWPVESDPEIVGAYVRALVRGPIEGFVRLIAVHHIACRIWPDLGALSGTGVEGGSSGGTEERAKKLLQAVVDQGGFDAVRDVVLYRQNREGTILLPPQCFEQPGTWRASRLEFAGKCGVDVKERLEKLLRV